MITTVGTLTVGAALPATAQATAAIDASVGFALPEVAGKLEGYTLALVPGPGFDMSAQVALADGAITLSKGLLDAAGRADLTAALEDAMSAMVDALADITAFNPVIGLELSAALATKSSLGVQAAAGVPSGPPNLNMDLIGDMIASIGATVSGLEAQLSIASAINASLGTAGLRVYRFDGDFAFAGSELQAQLNADGFSGSGHFVALVPTTPSAWTSLQATVRTS